MIEKIIVWAIICFCAFFIGKKFYLQFKRAADKNSPIDCGGGCSCCSVVDCSDKEKI